MEDSIAERATRLDARPSKDHERDAINDRLIAFDWSFQHRGNGHALEAIHPYPAKFVPEIPRTLLQSLPVAENTAILDPFCGSGSCLIEAQRANMSSIGIDLNPIACLISRVKTNQRPLGLLRTATAVAERAKCNRDPKRWDIPNVDHWFKQEIQEAVAALVQEIQRFAELDLKTFDVLRLALSSILVRVSNQDSDTRYAAVEKTVRKGDVVNFFLSSCGRIDNALSKRNWELKPVKVIESDVLKVAPEAIGEKVGIVITSPPYPNAYEYWLYHKYRMWWLGFDPLIVKSQEIGARAHFYKKDFHTEVNFWDQMRKVMSLIDAVLVDSGFACFVIGRSRIHGRIIDNADIIQAVASEQGLTLVSRFDRPISAKRKSFNLSHANINTETILVLQKECR